MYHDYTRTSKLGRKLVAFLSAILVCLAVFYFIGDSNAIQKDIQPSTVESAKVVNEQTTPEVFNAPKFGEEIKAAVPSFPLPLNPWLEMILATSEPAPQQSDAPTECTENVEPAEEPIPERENALYYFMEDGIRTDVPVEYQDYLYDLLKQHSCEDKYELVLAMIYHESGWRTNIVSATNDYGLMQINQCNHSWLKKELGITDFLDPYQSMQAGVYIISGLFAKYDSAEQALVCYNMGEGGALKRGITSSTYSRGILADMELLVKLES